MDLSYNYALHVVSLLETRSGLYECRIKKTVIRDFCFFTLFANFFVIVYPSILFSYILLLLAKKPV